VFSAQEIELVQKEIEAKAPGGTEG